jgi:hypothetical protein
MDILTLGNIFWARTFWPMNWMYVCAAGESSVLYTIYANVLIVVHLGSRSPMVDVEKRKVRNRVIVIFIGNSFLN